MNVRISQAHIDMGAALNFEQPKWNRGEWDSGREGEKHLTTVETEYICEKGGVVVGAKQESYWGVQSKGVFGTNALFNSILPPATLLFPLIFFAANRKAPVIPQCLAWQNSSITKSTFLNSFYKKTTFYLWLSNWWSSPVQDYWLFELYRQMVNLQGKKTKR